MQHQEALSNLAGRVEGPLLHVDAERNRRSKPGRRRREETEASSICVTNGPSGRRSAPAEHQESRLRLVQLRIVWTMLVAGGWHMVVTAEVELEAMRSDVLALRGALEAARQAAVTAEQRSHAEHKGEIDQLRLTISALRDEMIRQREELLAVHQTAERDSVADIEQLRLAVVAARRHADDLQQQHDLTLAQQAQRFDIERRELHDTIAELRRRLEIATSGDHR